MAEIHVRGLESVPDTPKEQAKHYLSEQDVPQLFECLTAGLLHHKPEDPVAFVQDALAYMKSSKDFSLKWNSFIEWKPPAKSRATTATDNKSVASLSVQ